MARPQRKAQTWDEYVESNPGHPTAKARRQRKPNLKGAEKAAEKMAEGVVSGEIALAPQPVADEPAANVVPFKRDEESPAPIGHNAQYAQAECWARSFLDEARVKFKSVGYPLPDRLWVHFGWTPGGRVKYASEESLDDGIKGGTGTFGCYTWSLDKEKGYDQIYVVPQLPADKVADILLHEFNHGAAGFGANHGKPFQDSGKAIGLVPTDLNGGDKPSWKTAMPGAELKAWINETINRLGEIPWEQVRTGVKVEKKKEGTRLIKLQCDCCQNDKGKFYNVNTTMGWIDEFGLPTCPRGSVMNIVERDKKGA